jgi:transcriptional regulator with XRE-family HTH domain
MTQKQLADRAGVDLDSLRKLERGRFANPSFFTIVALTRALGATHQLARRIK